jgi:hypothetical protein
MWPEQVARMSVYRIVRSFFLALGYWVAPEVARKPVQEPLWLRRALSFSTGIRFSLVAAESARVHSNSHGRLLLSSVCEHSYFPAWPLVKLGIGL